MSMIKDINKAVLNENMVVEHIADIFEVNNFIFEDVENFLGRLSVLIKNPKTELYKDVDHYGGVLAGVKILLDPDFLYAIKPEIKDIDPKYDFKKLIMSLGKDKRAEDIIKRIASMFAKSEVKKWIDMIQNSATEVLKRDQLKQLVNKLRMDYGKIKNKITGMKESYQNDMIDAEENCKKMRTAFNESVNNGDIEVCKELILMGVDLNKVDENGVYPISEAVKSGDQNMLSLLKRNYCDLDIDLGDKKTPLVLAIESKETDAAKYLIMQGVNINFDETIAESISEAIDENEEIEKFLIYYKEKFQ